MFHRETDAAKVARNRDAIFDLHAAALAWLERLHRHPVSVRQVRLRAGPVVPVRRHGASRRDLLQRRRPAARRVGDAESAARARQRHRARDRAHVVRRSRDDALVQRRVDEGGVRQLHGGEDRQPVVSRRSTTSCGSCCRTTRPPTRSIARRAPTPIRQPLDNLDEAGTLYGAIIYQKAPIVMRQLETHPRRGRRSATACASICAATAFGNATWPDLIALLDARTPEDLAAWSHAWVDEPGRPVDRDRRCGWPTARIAALAFTPARPDARARADLDAAAARCWSRPADRSRMLPVTPRRARSRRSRRARAAGAGLRAADRRRHRLRRLRARRRQPRAICWRTCRRSPIR